MRSHSILVASTLLLVQGLLPSPAIMAAPEPAAKPPSALALWDTGQSSGTPLEPSALMVRTGWSLVSSLEPSASFKGDAVLTNGRVCLVLRQQGKAAELYAQGPDGPVARVRLIVLGPGDEPVDHLGPVVVRELNRGNILLEVAGKTGRGTTLISKYRLKRGEVTVQVEPGPGAERLRVECPGRFAVLPDFFADDILVDAQNLTVSRADLPSENFLLHLADRGKALAMCVFENRQQDVQVNLAGTAENRQVVSSDIGFEGKKIWVALLEGPQVWHARDLKTAEAGQALALDWKMPYLAQWRVDFTRTNGLVDSWEMLLAEEKGNGFIKPTWLGAGADRLDMTRRRWNTVLGTYPYPCWSDRQGRGFLQPFKKRVLEFQGPVVVYPINRVEKTPLDAYTVVDIMRNTLGVGPCEYILDLEGQRSQNRGRATCSVRDELRAIYSKNQQKQQRERVLKVLEEGLIFVKHIRGRITRYVDFGHKMRDYLAAQKKTHPELAGLVDEMDRIAREIDQRVAARAAKIKNPAHVAAMNEDFRQNVLEDYTPQALEKCKKYSQALVEIGDNQDELSGECRWVVKALRQKAGLLMAQNPPLAPIAAEVRARTQEALRNPAGHEGAHH